MKVFITSKRGRPCQQKAANDNAPDRGTAELQIKRAVRAQGAATDATSHPLDLLLAHGLIDPLESRAGWHYAALYRRVIGRTEMSYGRLYAGLAGESYGQSSYTGAELELQEEELAAAQVLFRTAQNALRQEGSVINGIVERLVVFGAFPDWLLAKDAVALHQRNHLRRGLRVLAKSFRLSKGKTA